MVDLVSRRLATVSEFPNSGDSVTQKQNHKRRVVMAKQTQKEIDKEIKKRAKA